MNVFILSWDVDECARWHGDQHVGKMILEGTQLLCNAWWFIGGQAPYKPTHINHPCSVWARMNVEHWVYLRQLVLALGREFEHRFGKEHRSAVVARRLKVPPLGRMRWVNPPLVMPEQYHWGSVPSSYRLYYLHEKTAQHKWTRRAPPWWIKRDWEDRIEPEVLHIEGWEDVPPESVQVGLGTKWSPGVRSFTEDRFKAWVRRMNREKGAVRSALRGRDLLCICRGLCPGEVLFKIANSLD